MKGSSCVWRVRLGLFRTYWSSSCVLQRVVVSMCVVLCISWICGCRSHWNGCMIVVIWCCRVCVERCGFATWCCETYCRGCMNVAWAWFWGGSRSTKPCIFPCKVAAASDERYLVCAAVAAGVLPDVMGSFSAFCNDIGCSCVRSSMRLLNLLLQIALS